MAETRTIKVEALARVEGEGSLSIKVREACGLLKKSDHTITEISDRLGYQNLESFIRMFEKTMKVSPTQYRHKNQKKTLKK